MRINRGRIPVAKKIANLFNSIGSVLGLTLMVLMIFTLAAGVCTRYVFNRPLFWTDEFARILLIWSIFIGAALGFGKGSPIDHIGMDFCVSLLPQRLRKIVDGLAWCVTVFFCLTIAVLGARFFMQTISMHTAALEISQGYIHISLPIFAIISLVFLFDRWRHK